MVDQSIINIVRNYLCRLRDVGINPQLGVLFGSQVTGKTHEWSDIDLLVVSPVFDNMTDRRNVDVLWHLTARTDSRIEPIACGARQ